MNGIWCTRERYMNRTWEKFTMKQNYRVTSELGFASGSWIQVIPPFMTKQSAITTNRSREAWLAGKLVACLFLFSVVWIDLDQHLYPQACQQCFRGSQEIPRNPQKSPKGILSQWEWVGLAWGSIGSSGGWHCCFRRRLHRSSPAMGGHGPSAHGPESSVSDGSSLEDEADERGACSHPPGGRHQRPRVGRHVQQVGRRHPWQGRIQVRKDEKRWMMANWKKPVDCLFINWKLHLVSENSALALFSTNFFRQ